MLKSLAGWAVWCNGRPEGGNYSKWLDCCSRKEGVSWSHRGRCIRESQCSVASMYGL